MRSVGGSRCRVEACMTVRSSQKHAPGVRISVDCGHPGIARHTGSCAQKSALTVGVRAGDVQMSSESFFRLHPGFTHDEYAQSRGSGSPRTVDSLLRKHVQSGRIARVRRGLYVTVPPGGAAESVDPYLIATKAANDA